MKSQKQMHARTNQSRIKPSQERKATDVYFSLLFVLPAGQYTSGTPSGQSYSFRCFCWWSGTPGCSLSCRLRQLLTGEGGREGREGGREGGKGGREGGKKGGRQGRVGGR